MKHDERRWMLATLLLMAVLLVAGGALLRGFVARTLKADATVHLAFLDLALRDRSRYLASTLQEARERGRWPDDLAAVLTRNHADYNRDIFLQVFEPDGQPVAASANAPEHLALSSVARREGTRSLRWLTEETTDTSGRRWRLVTYPVYLGDPNDPDAQVVGFAQAGLPLPDADRALRRLTGTLVLALAGFGVVLVLVLRGGVRVAAEELRASQHRFIGDAAHELGTPLAVLRGEIDIALRRERTAPEYRVALQSCREEIERLTRLSENLLALASADAKQPLIHPAPCDAVDIVRVIHSRYARVAAEKQVVFEQATPDSLPWHADATAMEQVLGNLVVNAIRHTPAGERVTIRAVRDHAGTHLEVSDTGEGIPPAHLPRLFSRFHRVDKARHRSAGGAGLGLSIVKALVEAHGGQVRVRSELGRGSTFTCTFPPGATPTPS